jgi:hypothetical protein
VAGLGLGEPDRVQLLRPQPRPQRALPGAPGHRLALGGRRRPGGRLRGPDPPGRRAGLHHPAAGAAAGLLRHPVQLPADPVQLAPGRRRPGRPQRDGLARAGPRQRPDHPEQPDHPPRRPGPAPGPAAGRLRAVRARVPRRRARRRRGRAPPAVPRLGHRPVPGRRLPAGGDAPRPAVHRGGAARRPGRPRQPGRQLPGGLPGRRARRPHVLLRLRHPDLHGPLRAPARQRHPDRAHHPGAAGGRHGGGGQRPAGGPAVAAGPGRRPLPRGRPPGPNRRPDRGGQPACLGRRAAAGAGPLGPFRPAAVRGPARPRPLQGLQRPPRPPGGGPAAQGGGRGLAGPAAQDRPAGPLRRRGVRGAAARLRAGQRHGDRRAAPDRPTRVHLLDRGRRLGRPRARDPAGRPGRPGPVRGQGGRPRPDVRRRGRRGAGRGLDPEPVGAAARVHRPVPW